jgi:hypothetical protein
MIILPTGASPRTYSAREWAQIAHDNIPAIIARNAHPPDEYTAGLGPSSKIRQVAFIYQKTASGQIQVKH